MGNEQAVLVQKQNWLKTARAAVARKSFYFTVKLLDKSLDAMEKGREKMPARVKMFFTKLNDRAISEIETRKEDGLVGKSADKIAKLKHAILEKKRQLLGALGLDEKKLMASFGIERSFKLAKAGSHIDILQECLNFSVGVLNAVFLTGVAIYGVAKCYAQMAQGLDDMAFAKTIAPLVAYYLLCVTVPVAAFQRALTKIGNYMDLFQHIFMDSVSASIEKTVAGAKDCYGRFAKESIHEMIVDIGISWLPMPGVDTWRRVRAIKSEMRQLHHIERMEKLYQQSKACPGKIEE